MLTPTRVAPGPASAAFSAASPCTPPQHPILRGSALRGINEGSSNSPVRPFPSPAAARMERVAASAFPRASHPADQEPDNARRGGDRPPSTDLELHAQLTSVDLRSGSSLVVCDLASHATKQKRVSTSPDGRESWPSQALRRPRSGRLLSGGSDRAPRGDRRYRLVAIAMTRHAASHEVKAIVRAVSPDVRGGDSDPPAASEPHDSYWEQPSRPMTSSWLGLSVSGRAE